MSVTVSMKNMSTRNTAIIAIAAIIMAAILLFPTPSLAGPFDKVSYTSQQKSFSEYSAIYIAPVEVSLEEPANRFRRRRSNGNGARPVSDSDQASKANDLYEELVGRIGNKFELADGPGNGILTISTTITELQSSRPAQADFAQVISLDPNSLYAGGAAAVFSLSENGQDLATISDRYYGNLNDLLPRVGIWSDADRTFDRWSRNLAKFIAKN